MNCAGNFFQNISDTDYTICIRGTGNFSQRLYEVLAFGRIPIFIDTDSILPYDEIINWRDYCVWVKPDELGVVTRKESPHFTMRLLPPDSPICSSVVERFGKTACHNSRILQAFL